MRIHGIAVGHVVLYSGANPVNNIYLCHSIGQLLQVCRQIRQETKSIFFEENTFLSTTEMSLTKSCVRAFERW